VSISIDVHEKLHTLDLGHERRSAANPLAPAVKECVTAVLRQQKISPGNGIAANTPE
jgi:hypothetical protein